MITRVLQGKEYQYGLVNVYCDESEKAQMLADVNTPKETKYANGSTLTVMLNGNLDEKGVEVFMFSEGKNRWCQI